tara:strand:+ start:1297 stop:1578 length:282 start_codon:yes stop_codon:yes gene_type:complete
MISSDHLGKLVVIRWIDAKEIEYGWHSLEQIKNTPCPAILSVGWVADITNKELKLSADIPTDKDDDEAGRSQAIPIGCVEDVQILEGWNCWNI